EMPAITTDADLLRQVLLNLWRNAAEAMAEGGRLKVATTARVNWSGRAYAEISVRDSGAGIDGEQLAKVFHPVASRKGGDHEGIGLSIVKASVARLGGEVSCRSGRLGSEFLVLIPWQPPAAEPAQNRKGSS
ncbi:MAG TPA: ATP-binding protein, partial [Rhodocyclaceae bacterium]|nr:ATP-binding protein [Rhodocyclaceae bacterium]